MQHYAKLHCCVVTKIKLSIVLHWFSLSKSIKISINVDFFPLVSDDHSRAIPFSLFLITQVLKLRARSFPDQCKCNKKNIFKSNGGVYRALLT